MAVDIKVGDTVRFFYIRYGTQIITTGDVIEDVGNDVYIVKVSSGVEAEVPLNQILERHLRPEERRKPIAPISTDDPDASLNVGVAGIKFRHRRDRHGNRKDKS